MGGGILVVDDDPCLRELLDLHLRRAGYRVRLAEDALVAGRMLLDELPELLLVDVAMPYMSGQQLVATLMADQTIPHIPVLFLTTDDTFEPKARALGADVLLQPCRADELIAGVERTLAKKVKVNHKSDLPPGIRQATWAKMRPVTNLQKHPIHDM